jgi:hypothetical protein
LLPIREGGGGNQAERETGCLLNLLCCLSQEYEQALRGRLEASELAHRDELSPILR